MSRLLPHLLTRWKRYDLVSIDMCFSFVDIGGPTCDLCVCLQANDLMVCVVCLQRY